MADAIDPGFAADFAAALPVPGVDPGFAADYAAAQAPTAGVDPGFAADFQAAQPIDPGFAADYNAAKPPDTFNQAFNQGEIRNAPATWPDVGHTLLKLALSDSTDPNSQVLTTPQEQEAFTGTILPATAVTAGTVLAGPYAGLAAREALGLASGATFRGLGAEATGRDPFQAVTGIDPQASTARNVANVAQTIAPDMALSALPEVWNAAKAAGNALPAPIQAPFRSAAGALGNTASSAVAKISDLIAQRYPRYGAQVVYNNSLPPDLRSVISDRPAIPFDASGLATKPVGDVAANAAGQTTPSFLGEELWQHASRNLAMSPDPNVRAAGAMVNQAARMGRSFDEVAKQKLRAVLTKVNPLESDAVVNLLRQGIDVNAPSGLAAQARPVRQLLRDVGDLRTQYLYDKVNKARALDLMEPPATGAGEGLPAQIVGERQYVPAQNQQFYFPERTARTEDSGLIQSKLESILARNPTLSSRAAQRRLTGMQTSRTTGFAKTGAEGTFSTDIHDVLPQYVNAEGRKLVNAAVFGGKPVKITVGNVSFTVGERAAALYNHMVNVGDHQAARLFGNVLLELYTTPALGGWSQAAHAFTRRTSDMALGHVAITHLGQLATPAWAAGGPMQMARGESMVANNPFLRELFAAGPSHASAVDYMNAVRGDVSQSQPMRLMGKMQNYLRGRGSYAAVAMIDDISQEAKAAVDAGQPFTRALIKRSAEAGTTPQALAEELTRNGQLSPETWLNSIQSLADRWMYVAGPGEMPHAFKTPLGSAALQYKSFGVNASQHVKSDIIDPLIESIRTGDTSLRNLGLQRLRDAVTIAMPANAATSVLKSLARGRAPTIGAMAHMAFEGPGGIAADAGSAGLSLLAHTDQQGRIKPGPSYGSNPITDFAGTVPGIGIPADATVEIASGLSHKDPLLAAKGAATLAGARYPLVPMYGQLPIGLLRALTHRPDRR